MITCVGCGKRVHSRRGKPTTHARPNGRPCIGRRAIAGRRHGITASSTTMHTAPFGGTHDGPLDGCRARYCQRAALGKPLPVTVKPGFAMTATAFTPTLTSATTRAFPITQSRADIRSVA